VGDAICGGTGVSLCNAEARLKYLYAGDTRLRLTFSEDHTASPTFPELHSRPGVVERKQNHALK